MNCVSPKGRPPSVPRVVDLALDVLGQGDIAPLLPLVPLRLGQGADALPPGGLHHLTSHNNAGLADALDAWVNETLVDLLCVQRAGQSGGGLVDHGVGDLCRLCEDGTQTDAREDVDIVSLVGVVCDSMVRSLDGVGAERRARGKDDTALGPVDGLLEGALGLGERVGEREQDGPASEAARVDGCLERTHHALGENAEGGCQTNKSGWLDILDDLLERAELVAVVVCASEVLLVLGQPVTTVLGDKTLGVDKPELVLGGLL